MHSTGFEPAVPVNYSPPTHVLELATTGTGKYTLNLTIIRLVKAAILTTANH